MTTMTTTEKNTLTNKIAEGIIKSYLDNHKVFHIAYLEDEITKYYRDNGDVEMEIKANVWKIVSERLPELY